VYPGAGGGVGGWGDGDGYGGAEDDYCCLGGEVGRKRGGRVWEERGGENGGVR
jgi:hypothetical protein